MTKNERTSRIIASLCGKLLNLLKLYKHRGKRGDIVVRYQEGNETHEYRLCSELEFQSILGSGLTQAPDKRK